MESQTKFMFSVCDFWCVCVYVLALTVLSYLYIAVTECVLNVRQLYPVIFEFFRLQ